MSSTSQAGSADPGLTDEGKTLVDQMARRHDVSADAVSTLLHALERGGGTQAQFSHPDLGGMGQWSQHGMIMVGDMFNNELRARVDQLCNELAGLVQQRSVFVRASGAAHRVHWWPENLGSPSSSGGQNDMRYACFPETRRLAIQQGVKVSLYDTGDHRISGVAQQQSGSQDLSFTSQHGTVRLHELRRLGEERGPQQAVDTTRRVPDEAPKHSPFEGPRVDPSSGSTEVMPRPASAARSNDDVFDKLERLHDLQRRGILSDAEFSEKKKDLLARI